jgi:hypothetical protein
MSRNTVAFEYENEWSGTQIRVIAVGLDGDAAVLGLNFAVLGLQAISLLPGETNSVRIDFALSYAHMVIIVVTGHDGIGQAISVAGQVKTNENDTVTLLLWGGEGHPPAALKEALASWILVMPAISRSVSEVDSLKDGKCEVTRRGIQTFVRDIARLCNEAGHNSLDLGDVRTLINMSGPVLFGFGQADGSDRAVRGKH